MHRLEAHGVIVVVPPGWEAELSEQERAAPSDTGADASGHPLVVLHAASFPLPANRNDYGTDVTRTIDRNGIFISLIEFDEPATRTKLFATTGVPSPLPDDFSPSQLLWSKGNQSGWQSFFHVGARAFCVYIVIGTHAMRRILVPEADRLLSNLTIEDR